MSRPKIVLLGKLPPPYMGPAIATQILLRSSLTDRYDVHHVDTNAHGSLDSIGTWSMEKVRTNLRIYAHLARVLRDEKPDLVVIPISQATLGFIKDSVFVLLSWLAGRTTLIQLRGSNLQNWLASAPVPVRVYAEAVLRRAQGAIVLGNNLRHLFREYFREDHIFVVPNGANYDSVLGKSRSETVSTRRVRVLYLANLQPSKGIEDVIRAVDILTERGVTGFSLDVVGAWRDDATRDTCLNLVETHALPVSFHGPAYDADKFRFFAAADVFVFPPREPEGHPWVIVEALASGLPIISTDQGAITESVVDGVNGFIVAPKRPDQIADRVARLIEHPTLRSQLADASRQHYEAHFTEERMVEQLSDAVEHMVQPT